MQMLLVRTCVQIKAVIKSKKLEEMHLMPLGK